MRTQTRFPEVGRKAGHYESFYLKACRPGGGLGVWIRHTVHKRPRAEPTASVWFTLFDAEADGPWAAKATFPAIELSATPPAHIRVDGAVLEPGRAKGGVEAGDKGASWDLTISDDAEPFRHLPYSWMYRAPLPRTKLLSPYPAATYSGTISVDGRAISVERWPGMVGHNWGAEHAERWTWIHGAEFEGHPGSRFDIAAGRIKIGPWTTPWVGNGILVVDGEELRLGGLDKVRRTEIRDRPTGCELLIPGDGVTVRGRVQAPAKDFVAWVYADPDGGEHNTLNCSICDLELEVEREGSPSQRLAVRGAGAYEIGMRETDHGIPLQPYADG